MTSPRQTFAGLGKMVFAALLLLAGAGFLWGNGDNMFMPHAHCYLFDRRLMALHGISDFLIGLSYVGISATLVYLVFRAQEEIPFHWMMLAFAIFIVACGATHFMEVWTLQAENPRYWLSGGVKLVTAVASIVTAALLPPLIPKIVLLLRASRESAERKRELETANTELGNLYTKVRDLDRLKTNFFANVSHELRTPLALIFGPLDRVLESQNLSPAELAELTVARRNVVLLHKHVTDLLDVSRIDAGKMDVAYANVDLAQLVRRTASFFDSHVAERLQTLTVDVPEGLPAQLDTAKIERVLLNLLSNAFKFTPEGGAITVSLRVVGDEITLQVDDTGPGVPPELRSEVFDRFQRGDLETNARHGGTGLGLSIVKEFVELHRGKVAVREAAAGGASFIVTLPRSAPAGASVEPAGAATSAGQLSTARDFQVETDWAHTQTERLPVPPKPAAEDPAKAGQPLVLIAEDNPEMNAFVSRLLAPDCRTKSALNGAQALELAREEKPDLILSDMMMPGLSGEELLAAVRADEQLRDVPVILLTARTDDELKLSVLQHGAQDYVTKPFAIDELRARVRNQLQVKRIRETLQRELVTQTGDLAQLAQEVSTHSRELDQAREQAEAAHQAKDRFLAVLSHELRTPLTPALVAVSALQSAEEIPTEELQQSLAVIRRNIELETRLVDDLLDLTRLTRGVVELRKEPVNLHEILQHAVETSKADPLRPQPEIVLELAADAFQVLGEAPRLQQVFWNLILNAGKFTPANGRITVRTRNPGPNSIRVEVSDTGVGIEAEMLLRIFDPFQQGEVGVSRRFGGLGPGLALVKELVEAHGGSIAAASPGTDQGSTFTLEFPTLPAGSSAPTTATQPARVPARKTISLSILLAEDHVETREAIERLFKRLGHSVQSAGTVAEAIAKLGSHHFDLLLSDIGLPDGLGTEIMEEAAGRSALVGVAMSGFGTEADLARSRAAGFREHLVKPVSADQLKAVIQQLATDRITARNSSPAAP
ncbi:MAG TPA: ATP-binding protein [Chthoniobacteraceae bacterium]